MKVAWWRVAAPVAVAVLVLGAWQVFVVAGHVATYVLPSPSSIVEALSLVGGDVAKAALASGTNAVVGLVAGTVAALVAAAAATRLRWLDEALTPLVAAGAAIPIVALAPLLSTMFGATSQTPRRFVVTLVVFLPVFVNALRGLRQVEPLHADLLRSCAGSSWDLTRTVRLPGALPYVFTGLRLAASTSVIAAVVAEYFGGLQDGLGSRITSAASNSAYPRAWAYVTGACLLGLCFYGAALLAERLATPWRRPPSRR